MTAKFTGPVSAGSANDGLDMVNGSDSDMTYGCEGFTVYGAAGDVHVITELGSDIVRKNCQIGELIPLRCSRICATGGTTATGIFAYIRR